jgi:cytidylate kinase
VHRFGKLNPEALMFRVITIEREYGSGAASVAKMLASRLGWTLWDAAFTREIAKRLNCTVETVEQREERPDPTFYRLARIFMRGSFEDATGSRLEFLDAENLAALFERICNDIASQGNSIIVGRGAPWFLRERPDTFHLFLYAPYEEKLKRLQAKGKTAEEAEELLASVDKERAAFVKKYYNKIWPQRDLYHMMVNSKVGFEVVADLVLREMELLSRTPLGEQSVRPR